MTSCGKSNLWSLVLLVSFLVISLSNFVKCESDQEDCPDPKEIYPCKCDRQGLSCYELKDEQDLRRVFQASNRYKAYRSVWINGTPIKKLEKGVFNGHKISAIFIEDNELEEVEEGAFEGTYQYIKRLSLYSNKLTSMPKDLEKMVNLQTLSLANNKINKISREVLAGTNSLQVIQMDGNQIADLKPYTFRGASSLRTIILSRNNFTVVPPYAFAALNGPSIIDLSRNNIFDVDPKAFRTSIIAYCDLSFNQLTYLDQEVFGRSGFGVAHVADNPFVCHGCSKYSWLLDVESEKFSGFKCKDGRELDDLTPFNIGCV